MPMSAASSATTKVARSESGVSSAPIESNRSDGDDEDTAIHIDSDEEEKDPKKALGAFSSFSLARSTRSQPHSGSQAHLAFPGLFLLQRRHRHQVRQGSTISFFSVCRPHLQSRVRGRSPLSGQEGPSINQQSQEACRPLLRRGCGEASHGGPGHQGHQWVGFRVVCSPWPTASHCLSPESHQSRGTRPHSQVDCRVEQAGNDVLV